MTPPSGTVTLLFTDIEGSTRLWEDHPEAMGVALRRHDEILRQVIGDAGGYVFKAVGDAFCAAFSRARDGAEAAATAQRLLRAERWPEPLSIRVRMAFHTGACEERDMDYFGPTVNRTARLEAIAHGGQVLISQATADLLVDSLPEGLELRDLGQHRLRDLGRAEHVFQLDREDGEYQFPPLRSLDNPELRNNLPVQLTTFVGREAEFAAVRTLVNTSRLVTLIGAGGVGKTRLALQAAAEMLDLERDGVWFVDLAPLADPDLVASTVAAAIGVREQRGEPVSQSLLAAMRHQRALIVLDNCEHLVDACAKLTDNLLRRCPDVRVLATSREPLRLEGESLFRVPSLSVPSESSGPITVEAVSGSEAAQLLIERVRTQRPDFRITDADATAVASICRRLDGIPLAIELAAARFRTMSAVDIAVRLHRRFALLTGGAVNARPRQQTLRGMVDWSYDLLNNQERAVLRRLSVFAGSFDLDAADKVCSATGDLDAFQVETLLASLVDKSLVQPEFTESNVRYRLLETVRQYAAERLAETGTDETPQVNQAHAGHYADLVDEAAPHLISADQLTWLARLESDLDNIRSAIAYLASAQQVDVLVRMAKGLRSFWYYRDHLQEAVEVFDQVQALSVSDSPPADHGWVLCSRGMFELESGDRHAARDYLEEALSLARASGDLCLVAESLTSLTWERFFEFDFATAVANSDAALAVPVEETGLHLRGLIWQARGAPLGYLTLDPEAARHCYLEALACFREAGDRFWEAASLQSLAEVCQIVGDFAAALEHLDKAEALLGELLNDYTRCFILHSRASVKISLGDLDGALDSLAACLPLSLRSGTVRIIAAAAEEVAHAAAAMQRNDQAVALYGAAEVLFSELSVAVNPITLMRRHSELDRLRSVLGNETFDRAYRAGHQLDRVGAIELATAALPELKIQVAGLRAWRATSGR